jgi:large subunit ribosomal protein L4
MEGITHKVLSQAGKEVASVTLGKDVFDAPIKEDLVHATVRWQLVKRRAGTHSALTKGMMEGGAKKPWRQKGTGRARAGTATSPVWVGGAVAHGPLPREYNLRITKRARRQALASVLSDKRANDQLFVLDSLTVKDGKTKSFASVLKALGIQDKKALLVTAGESVETLRAVRNMKTVTSLPIEGVNVYDLLKNEVLICSKDAVAELEKRVRAE